MKCLALLPAVLLLGICSGCGGDSPESLASESMSTMREMIETFDTIKDPATAKAAKPKLTSIAQQMKSLKDRQQKLPPPSDVEKKAMMAKYGKDMQELQLKLMTVMTRISSDPGIQKELSDIDMGGLK